MTDATLGFSGGPIANSIIFYGGGTEVLRIGPDGEILWRGRKVEGDEQFRAAMLDLHKLMRTSFCGGIFPNAADAASTS